MLVSQGRFGALPVIAAMALASSPGCESGPQHAAAFELMPGSATGSELATAGTQAQETEQVEVPEEVPEPDARVDCGAVDLLFVVDNSASMADEQRNLVRSFPGFIAQVKAQLGAGTSYHVGVVSTDANAFNHTGCQALGALVTRTGGEHSSQAVCGPYLEGGYMTARDDLEGSFACAAQLGTEGSIFETPIDALVSALQPAGPTSVCNAGFLRPDALLVVVLITDEEDRGDSQGEPLDWYETVLAAKGGDAGRVVVLSLIGHDKPNACIAAQWTGDQGAELAPRLGLFTEMFEHGWVRDVCAPSYVEFFVEAVGSIAAVCTYAVG